MIARQVKFLAESLLPRKVFCGIQARRSNRTQRLYLEKNGFLSINRRYLERWGRTVRNGPFAGLIYAEAAVRDRFVVPQLLGATELQLHTTIESIVGGGYQRIVNIGWAEGYYAVGLARRAAADVFAFDAEQQVLNLCRENALVNGVCAKLRFGGWCGPPELVNACGSSKSLIFSDCEGYEFDLFTESTLNKIGNADFVIELHENEVHGVTEALTQRLSGTHSIRIIDDQPAEATNYRELDFLGGDAPLAVCENRQVGQQWLFATRMRHA